MFYVTRIDDDSIVLIEAETSGAFSKSDLEIKPNPQEALLNSIDLVGKVARAVSEQVGAQLEGTPLGFEVQFGVKADGSGSVMIAQNPGAGQFLCRVVSKG